MTRWNVTRWTRRCGSPRPPSFALVLGCLLLPSMVFADDALDRALSRVASGAPWPRQPLLEDARDAAEVDVAWPSTPLLGAGATVCVVDTGVDLLHPTFRDAAGATRARWVLDVSAPPRGVHAELEAIGGGAVYDADEIDAALSAGDAWVGDWHGHGTAIAAAALGDDAGLGSPSPGAYAGVAPRALLVVVRALRRGTGGLLDEDLIAGARFCAAVMAREQGVMLFALGGHDGAHDGSEPLEAELARLVSRGWVIVAAAGNEGDARIHAGGTTSPGVLATLELLIPAPERADARVVIAIRGDAPVSIVSPDGRRDGGVPRGERVELPGLIVDGRSERATYVVLRAAPDLPLTGGTYRLVISGGDFDAWITEHNLGAGFDRPTFSGRWAREAETVAIPATEPSVIAVGSMVSRAAWSSDTGGDGLVLEPEPETRRASFSARGPSASGAFRPDLLAPGGLIRTALSSSIEVGDEALFGDESALSRFRRGDGVVLAGTSISAAMVAGAIALARAESSGSSPEDERAALILGAAEVGGALHLDVAGYLSARGARVGLTPDAMRSSLTLSRDAARPGLASVFLEVVARDASGLPIEGPLEVRRVDDHALLATGRLERGLYRGVLTPISGDVGTDVLLEASSDGVVLGRARLGLRPDERGHDVAIGGCSASVRGPGRPPSSALAVLLVGLLAGLFAGLFRRRG